MMGAMGKVMACPVVDSLACGDTCLAEGEPCVVVACGTMAEVAVLGPWWLGLRSTAGLHLDGQVQSWVVLLGPEQQLNPL